MLPVASLLVLLVVLGTVGEAGARSSAPVPAVVPESGKPAPTPAVKKPAPAPTRTAAKGSDPEKPGRGEGRGGLELLWLLLGSSGRR